MYTAELTTTTIRHANALDIIPLALEAGFDRLNRLDYEWIWVIEDEGSIRGILIAAPCHGCVWVYRLACLPNTPTIQLIKLLRTFLHDIKQRGNVGLLTFLDPKRQTESKLERILRRLGGKTNGPYRVVSATLTGRDW